MHEALDEFGVHQIEDLAHLTEDDLLELETGLKRAQRNQLKGLVDSLRGDPTTTLKRTKEVAMGSTYTTGLTPSKARQRNGSTCFTAGGTARTGVEQAEVSLTYRNIGPVGGDEVLVTGKETMEEMNDLLPTPLPGRKEVNRVVRHPGAANKKDHNKSHEARNEFDKTKKRQTKEKLAKFIGL